MKCKFAVQASNPRSLAVFDPDDRSLSDAVQTVFPLETEFALIVWNWVYIPLSYKYDVSMMVDDLVDVIGLMLATDSGRRTIQWPSNAFAATWELEWGVGTTTVNAEWTCVLGGTESVLAAKPTIRLQTAEFVGEWKRLLEIVAGALNAAGYTVEHLVGIRRLNELAGRIGHYGILYRD